MFEYFWIGVGVAISTLIFGKSNGMIKDYGVLVSLLTSCVVGLLWPPILLYTLLEDS